MKWLITIMSGLFILFVQAYAAKTALEPYSQGKDKQACPYLVKAASGGDAEAHAASGYQFLNGKGVQQDYQQVFQYYLEVAEQGKPGVGYMYARGWCVKQNYAKARLWYEMAPKQNLRGV